MASRLKLVTRRLASAETRSGIAQWRQEPDQRLAFGDVRHLVLRHRADAQEAIGGGGKFGGIGGQLRPGVGELGIGNGGRPARAALDRNGVLLFQQHFDRIGNERDPGFATRGFIENSKSHESFLVNRELVEDDNRQESRISNELLRGRGVLGVLAMVHEDC